MSHPIVVDAKSKMDKTQEAFQAELGNIRTGRATAGLLDIVEVEVYGSKMKINQLGTITVPDPHMIAVDLWDKSQMHTVEKAIIASPLGLNPSNDGKLIRVPIPTLTEERRKELVKRLHHIVEEHRVTVRNVRRDSNEAIKKLLKDKLISEDDDRRGHEETQKLTDAYIAKLDQLAKAKEKDILEVK